MQSVSDDSLEQNNSSAGTATAVASQKQRHCWIKRNKEYMGQSEPVEDFTIVHYKRI
jgi:hypothetical protein